MIRIFIFTGLVMCFSVGMVFAEAIPMIDRHIFLPESPGEQKEESPAVPAATGSALEKEILFSGVLVTPKGKQAIISENIKNDKTKQKHVYKEGDQIKGMTVKEIGSNYVMIATKENTVRLNLYKGIKSRPAPAPEPVNADTQNSPKPGMTADANQQGGAKNDPKTGTPAVNPGQKSPAEAEGAASPFGGRNGKAASSDSGKPASTGGGVNPFTDILKGAGNRSGQGNAAGGLPFNLPAGN